MSYDKMAVRQAISDDNVFSLLEYFNAEPRDEGDYITSITVCHGGDSRKLYYYKSTGLFHCYTHCGSFDIFDLIRKVEHIDDLNEAVNWVVSFFRLEGQLDEVDSSSISDDFKIFQKWQELDDYRPPAHEEITLDEVNVSFLKNYPDAKPWMLDKGISDKAIKYMGVKYDPIQHCVVFPVTDENKRIIGVRRRAIDEDDILYNGKYRPWTHNGVTYTFPSMANLYTTRNFYRNVEKYGKAIVFEGEKSVLKYISMYKPKNNISCALQGSNFSRYQFDMLRRHGANEIVVCFDRDYTSKRTDDPHFMGFVRKLQKVYNEYSQYCNLSFAIDRDNLLGYKDSPIDCGKDVFEHTIKDRQVLSDKVFKNLEK